MEQSVAESLASACGDDIEGPFKKIIVRELLSGFCTATKRIVFLASFERLTQEEIAETLGISRTTVQKKWNEFIVKARRRCKEES
jgi:DNA-directed RNA polymerase specialized sigma24 family protein